MKKLLQIFCAFFKIGLFTIGGGYAMLPIIQRDVVEKKHWMEDREFLDAISLTSSLPGPLATNAATFVGYHVAGVPGAIFAVLGAATPSVLIILLVAAVFQNLMAYPVTEYVFKGIRPAVVALIVYAVVKLAKSADITKYLNWLVAGLAFLCVGFFHLHPIFVVVGAAVYGLFLRHYIVKWLDGRRKA
ncbi:MAG: chromate transporter [Oscillospiraceae bacterium]